MKINFKPDEKLIAWYCLAILVLLWVAVSCTGCGFTRNVDKKEVEETKAETRDSGSVKQTNTEINKKGDYERWTEIFGRPAIGIDQGTNPDIGIGWGQGSLIGRPVGGDTIINNVFPTTRIYERGNFQEQKVVNTFDSNAFKVSLLQSRKEDTKVKETKTKPDLILWLIIALFGLHLLGLLVPLFKKKRNESI